MKVFLANTAPFPGKHLILVPFSHTKSIREISEQELEELNKHKSCLQAWAKSNGDDVIYFETALNFNRMPHAKLDVLFGPSSLLSSAPIFFSKHFSDLDGNWSVHKKILKISSREGGLNGALPPNFPYVSVEWKTGDVPLGTSMLNNQGIAHVIEKEDEFKRKGIFEVFGTVIEMDDLHVRRNNQ